MAPHSEKEVTLKLNISTLLIVSIGLIAFVTYTVMHPWTWWRVTGFAIAIPAFALLFVSRLQLGHAFSVGPKATMLVTSGIYSRIRNPIYVFGSIMVLGLIIWSGRPWLLVFLAVLVPMQVIRSHKEAQLLAAKFGNEYIEYKQKTWF